MAESTKDTQKTSAKSAQDEKLHTERHGDAHTSSEAEVQYVLGPVWMQEKSSANITDFKAMLICPICDEDRYKDNEDVAKLFHEMRDEHRIAVCSTEWLTGQKLTGVGFKRLRDDAECVCFETALVLKSEQCCLRARILKLEKCIPVGYRQS
ncbi:hypothetical protein AB1Y20_021013 [Prymnesium parvum]|uniref:Uncharacterized protein n=1 Tax=Prymnesium parvum TaxID=97485 RepID=A0AB34JHL4_PRYPA